MLEVRRDGQPVTALARPMALRHATRADADALAAFAAQAFWDTYRDIDDPVELADHIAQHLQPAAFAASIADPRSTTLLAEIDAQLAGYTQIRVGTAPSCVSGPAPVELARLYLGQSFIGQGHGAALMRAAQAEALRRGGRTLWLGVYDRNTRAVRFYERFGFTRVGGQEFLFGGRVYVDPIYAVALQA